MSRRVPRSSHKPPLNFGDRTLAASELRPHTVGFTLCVENYPSLAGFRFPGMDSGWPRKGIRRGSGRQKVVSKAAKPPRAPRKYK